MKQKLQEIITDYPYVLPNYLKILFSGLGTLVIIGIIITVWFFRKKGCTTLSTGFQKPSHPSYLPNAPSKDILSEAPVQTWQPPTSSHRASCKIEEIELEPILQRTPLPVPPDRSRLVTFDMAMNRCSQLMVPQVQVTLETVAMALKKTTNLNFDQFFKKKQSHINSRPREHSLKIQRL